MKEPSQSRSRISLDVDKPIWDRFFMVAPLVLVGTREEDGQLDLAPKHMAMPMGWENYFGFVCTPAHRTYANIQRSGVFTVSFPRPSQLLFMSLAASPRCDAGAKPVLQAFSTFKASKIDGAFVEDASVFLECEHFKTVEGFGSNSLITGKVIAAYADESALRVSDADEQQIIHDSPLFAYLPPSRFASIDTSNSFPFPADMKK